MPVDSFVALEVGVLVEGLLDSYVIEGAGNTIDISSPVVFHG